MNHRWNVCQFLAQPLPEPLAVAIGTQQPPPLHRSGRHLEPRDSVIRLDSGNWLGPKLIEKRNVVRTISRRAVLGAPATLLIGVAPMATAQPNLTALAALLIDLPGWQAEKPDTMSATQGGNTVSYAARQYEQGEKQLMTMLGRSGLEHQVPMAAGNNKDDFSMDVDGISTRIRTLRGFRVATVYEKASNEGMVLVYLGNTATTFVLQFNGITLDEALALTQRFDWTAMQRTLGTR